MKVDWDRIIWSVVILNSLALIISVLSGAWQIFATVAGTQIAGYLFGIGFACAVFTNKPGQED